MHPTKLEPTTRPVASRAALGVVYTTVFLDLLGFGVILPLLPYYAETFGATGFWVGAILTSYSAMQFLGSPVLGRISDRVGRRPVLLFSLAGAAVAMLLTGLSESLWTLLAARGAAGLCGGSIGTAQAYIADVTAPHERARYMGFLGASIGLGFVFGPALGAMMSPWGFGAAAFVAAGLGGLNFAVALVKLRESRPAGERRASHRGQLSLRAVRLALAAPAVGLVVQAMFLATLGFVVMEATFPLLGGVRFGLNDASLGWTLVYVGVVVVIVQGGLIGRLVARWGEQRIAIAGSFIMAVGLAGIPFATSLWAALAFLGLLATGQGFVSPTLSTLLSRAADPDAQGSVLGVGQGMAALARAIGPLAAGWAYDRVAGIPYWFAAGFMIVAAISLQRLARLSVGKSPRSA